MFFRKTNINGVAALVPSDEDSEAWLKRRKFGDAVALEAVGVRNMERLNLYWVLCGLVAENHADLTSKDAVDEALKVLGGHFSAWITELPDGSKLIIRKAKSIAVANMKEADFEAYFERCLALIGSELLPGADIEEMRKEAYVRSGASR